MGDVGVGFGETLGLLVVEGELVRNAHAVLAAGEEVEGDEEGLAIMRQLARNLAWLLRCIEAGRAAGIPDPELREPVMTNFIR